MLLFMLSGTNLKANVTYHFPNDIITLPSAVSDCKIKDGSALEFSTLNLDKQEDRSYLIEHLSSMDSYAVSFNSEGETCTFKIVGCMGETNCFDVKVTVGMSCKEMWADFLDKLLK